MFKNLLLKSSIFIENHLLIYILEKKLFILSHPKAPKSEIDKHTIGWKPRCHVVKD